MFGCTVRGDSQDLPSLLLGYTRIILLLRVHHIYIQDWKSNFGNTLIENRSLLFRDIIKSPIIQEYNEIPMIQECSLYQGCQTREST